MVWFVGTRNGCECILTLALVFASRIPGLPGMEPQAAVFWGSTLQHALRAGVLIRWGSLPKKITGERHAGWQLKVGSKPPPSCGQ